MSEVVRIKKEVVEQMLAEARRIPGLECCGLLAGRDGIITTLLPVANALGSPTAYQIAPRELFRVFRAMREAGLDHLGIYHSHPTTANAPSPRDIELAFYPEAAYFILSPQPDARRPVRAYRMQNGHAAELVVTEVP